MILTAYRDFTGDPNHPMAHVLVYRGSEGELDAVRAWCHDHGAYVGLPMMSGPNVWIQCFRFWDRETAMMCRLVHG